ncbi:MAG: DNA-binding protein [Ignavibacteriales bacterium]|nr:DNA-binding protein [Ignavibacteriales bacterium]
MTNYKLKKTIIGQFPYGTDLLEELTKFVKKENIHCGRIHGIGATTHAIVAYYDQNTKKYNSMEFAGGMEILNLTGNISIRDSKPFVHVHLLLGDPDGKVFGGHLMPGTKLWACEVFIDEFDGEELVREQDEKTGLFLWKTGILS